jgi:hypothetical protein
MVMAVLVKHKFLLLYWFSLSRSAFGNSAGVTPEGISIRVIIDKHGKVTSVNRDPARKRPVARCRHGRGLELDVQACPQRIESGGIASDFEFPLPESHTYPEFRN